MEQENREYPLAYAPIPKGIIKEEPEDREEFGEVSELLMAYPPLPHGVIKEESQFEDGIQDETMVIGYIKEEPTVEEEDGDECSFLAYSPLPHGDMKEESEVGDGHDEFSSGVQTLQQRGKESLVNEATGDAFIIVPFVETPSSGNDIETGEPTASKRKRTRKGDLSSKSTPSTSSRVLRSRSKGSSRLKNAGDRVKQLEDKELTMSECDAGAKEQQVHASIHQPSLADKDLDPNYSLAGSAQQKKKTIRKLSGKANYSQEKANLPFKCKNCGGAFKVENYLKKHLARACGIERRFPCKECDNQFTRKEHLQNHLMKVHKVQKLQLAEFGAGPSIRPDALPFKCHKCNRSYKQKNGLAIHLKYECEVDPSFPCTLCDYRATRKGSLQDHLMTVHNVDRSQFTALGAAAPFARPVQPFKCEKCGRTYKMKRGLREHLTYECGVDPSFPCNQCDYRAKRRCHLKSHVMYVHGIN